MSVQSVATRQTSRGYFYPSKEENVSEHLLSHDFKPDVVKMAFEPLEAADLNTMFFALDALLKGISRETGIKRTDIKESFSAWKSGNDALHGHPLRRSCWRNWVRRPNGLRDQQGIPAGSPEDSHTGEWLPFETTTIRKPTTAQPSGYLSFPSGEISPLKELE